MPKVLVLFDDADATATALGESAAEGARGVRFTEVDARVPATASGSRRKALASPSEINEYDAVVIVAGNESITPALENLLAALTQTSGAHGANIVFGVAEPRSGKLSPRVLALGGIVVGRARAAEDDISYARALGARVAVVAGWVRHSLAHEESEAHAGHHHHGHHHAH